MSAGPLARYLNRLLSDDPLIRATAIQSAIFAFGTGAFITSEAVYSVRIIGLSVSQAGLGLTIGMAAQFLVSIPFGRVADTIGPRTCWVLGNVLQAFAFLGWLFVHGFWPFIAAVVAREVCAQLGQIGWSSYRLAAFPKDERVRSGAYNRAALNVGFTLGALVGGAALGAGSLTVVKVVPVLTAVVLLVSAAKIIRLPSAAAARQATREPAPAPARTGRPAIRNAGFLLTSFFDGVLGSNQTLLLTVIPLWLVADTNAPRVLLAWLFATNTIGAVLFSVPVSRTVTNLRTSLRAEYRATAFLVASCLITMVTDHTIIWVTIPLIWIAHMTVTGAELFNSSAQWGWQSELSHQQRLGDYQGIASVGSTLGTVWTPALFTFLATTMHVTGWLIMASIFIAAAIAIRPSAMAAQRFIAADHARTAEPAVAAVE